MLITQWLTCMATGDAALYLHNTLLEMDSFAEHFSAFDDNFSRFIQSHSTTFTHLPHEAHQHVLSFLPAKAALRMQCVNRTWRYNSIGPIGAEYIARNPRFKELNLSGNGIGIVPESAANVGRTTRAEVLNLGNNPIGQTQDALVANSINENPNLRKLDVSGTGLGVQAFVTLLQNQDLTSLNFGSNSVGEDDLPQVVAALYGNQSFTSLNLSNNHLSDESIRTLGTTVGIVRPDLELIL
jgi:Ran GTPase-activating protein (RanGAP) involved in mRNA processing and transport